MLAGALGLCREAMSPHASLVILQCQCQCQSWIYIAHKRKASNAFSCFDSMLTGDGRGLQSRPDHCSQ